MSPVEPYPGDEVEHGQDDERPADVDLPDEAFDPAAPCPQDEVEP
jgi:hypothetical protein